MPIVYETAAPIAQFGAVARDSAAAAGGGGGYGRGYGSQIPYDTGIQDAIQFRDQHQFRMAAQGQETQARFDALRANQEGELAMQNQRFQLQAELQQVELSQTERMRLQRLKNAVGEVSADPTLTDVEKADLIQQLKFNVDPLQRRLSQERLKQEQMVKESMVEQRRADAALKEEAAKVHASGFDARTHYYVDPQTLAAITEDFKKNTPMSHLIPPAAFEQMARQEAMRQGLGKPFFQQSPGKWEAIGPGAAGRDMGGDGDGTGRGTGRGGTDHPSGLTAQEYSRLHGDAAHTVDRRIAAKERDGETVSDEVRQQMIERELEARLGGLKKYAEQAPQKQQKGYASPFAPAAAAKPAGPIAPMEVRTAALDRLADRVNVSALDPQQKAEANGFLKSAQKLIAQYPDPATRPREVQAQIEQIAKAFEQYEPKIVKQEDAARMRSNVASGVIKKGEPVPDGYTVGPPLPGVPYDGTHVLLKKR